MKSKKGFANPYYLAGVALFIIIILSLGWNNSSTKSQEEIEAERLRNQNLQAQLYETQTDLDKANEIIQNQTNQINKLTQYENSYGYFPLFWMQNIYLTQNWILVINIALFSFSLITIKFILNLGKNKR